MREDSEVSADVLGGGTEGRIAELQSELAKANADVEKWRGHVEEAEMDGGNAGMALLPGDENILEKRQKRLQVEQEKRDRIQTQLAEAQSQLDSETAQNVERADVRRAAHAERIAGEMEEQPSPCLLYTSPSPRDS